MGSISVSETLPRVQASEDPALIYQKVLEAGGVIIEGFLTPEQAAQLNQDIDEPFSKIQMGSTSAVDVIRDFHGEQTKRLTNLITYSRLFRDEVMDLDLVYDICDQAFKDDNKSYWMAAAQAIEINAGNKAQPLHRDQSQWRVFDLLGAAAPEACVNFLIALTDFTEENGATRVIPGSNRWEDWTLEGQPDKTVPALMKPGDACLLSGKTIHGGGANHTTDFKRRGVGFGFVPSYLTPEEAYPFQISIDTARTMSKRAQRSIGYRSQYPAQFGGLWTVDYSELADYIGLDQ